MSSVRAKWVERPGDVAVVHVNKWPSTATVVLEHESARAPAGASLALGPPVVVWTSPLRGDAVPGATLTGAAVALDWAARHNVHRATALSRWPSGALGRPSCAARPGAAGPVVLDAPDGAVVCFACVTHYDSMHFTFRKREGAAAVAVAQQVQVDATHTEVTLAFAATERSSSHSLVFRSSAVDTSATPLPLRVYAETQADCADDAPRGLFMNYMFADSDLEPDLLAQVQQLRQISDATALLFLDRRNDIADPDVVLPDLRDCDANAYPGTPHGALLLQARAGALVVLERLAEPNMDDPRVLRAFVEDGVRRTRGRVAHPGRRRPRSGTTSSAGTSCRRTPPHRASGRTSRRSARRCRRPAWRGCRASASTRARCSTWASWTCSPTPRRWPTTCSRRRT